MKVNYPGVAMRLGPSTWIVPPLSLGQVKKLRPLLAQVTKTSRAMIEAEKNGEQVDPESINQLFECYVPVIQAALSRNYPDITVDDVEAMLDMGNHNQALMAAMGKASAEVVDEVGELKATVDPGLTGQIPTSISSTAA
jgi:hypothetical protein